MSPNQTVTNIYYFDAVDYTVFSSLLIISALTGLYYGCKNKYCNKTGQTLNEYLTGNKSLTPFPVALSLIGGFLSAAAILGLPSDIYNFGTQDCFMVFAVWLCGLVVRYVYLPVYLKLQVSSSYEYLELRFNRSVRTIVSFFFVLSELIYLPVVIYDPSLAFNQVSGINIHIISSIICMVCVFYTLLGGFKAVVWTDSWQVIIMFLSMLVVIILGTISIGGPSAVIDFTRRGGRLIFFNFTPSMYEKYTFFSVIIGGCIHWVARCAVHQTSVQKYLSLPNDKQSKQSVLMFILGMSFFISLCSYSGMLAYATYHDCDPLSMGRIKTDDQIIPLFVMETIGQFKGVPGLFVAGIFSAAMSTLSVMFNVTSQIVYEDFIKGFMRINLTERTAMIVVKSVVLILGLLSLALIYVVEHMGGILTLTVSIVSITEGPAIGIFSLGMLIPWANSYGAIIGGIAGIILSALVALGNHFVKAAKMISTHKLPVFVNESCFDKYHVGRNISIPDLSFPDESSVFPLFKISYLWITTVGAVTVLIVGVTVSFITGKTNLKLLDQDLISPVVQWILPREAGKNAGSTVRRRIRRELEEGEKMLTEIQKMI